MIGFVTGILLKSGMAQKTAEKLAKPALVIVFIIVAVPTILALKSCYDNSVIDAAVSEANVDALDKKDRVTGEADNASADRQDQFDRETEAEKDMIDEAIKLGCDPLDAIAGKLCPQNSLQDTEAE